MPAQWIVERTVDTRFPYRVRIEQDGRTILAVRARHAWPGPGMNIFCLREREFDPTEALTPFEQVPVEHLSRNGRKLAVTLDRGSRKRCEFVKVEKPLPSGELKEEIYFRTESGNRAHRTSGRVELFPTGAIDVVIDSGERYAWTFPGARVTKRKLPVGDYALVRDERVVAVVERKSLENLVAEVAQVKGMHQQFAHLAHHSHAAFVVEGQYGDLADPRKIGRWPSSHLLRVVAELAALHPTVPIVFAGNRKLANVWAQRWFAAVAAASERPAPDLVAQTLARYEPTPASGGVDAELRAAALVELPDGFSARDLLAKCPGADARRVSRVLTALRVEGRLRREGASVRARWMRVPSVGSAPS